jgi:hypothetical protein
MQDPRTYGMPRSDAIELVGLLSVLGSITCALFWLFVVSDDVPDENPDTSAFIAALCDPYALFALVVGIVISSAIVFLLGLWFLRGRQIVPTFVVVLATTIAGIALTTPVAKRVDSPNAYVAVWLVAGYGLLVASLTVCRGLHALKLPRLAK